MTAKQQKLYLSKWLQVKQTLVSLGGYSPKEADTKRHEIHVDALGVDKSSKKFTNSDLDRVLDEFQKYLGLTSSKHPDRAVKQPRLRLIKAIEALQIDEPYIESICRPRFKSDDWRTLDERALKQLLMTLKSRKK